VSRRVAVEKLDGFEVIWEVYENEPENKLLLSQFEKPAEGHEWMWCLHCGRVYRFGDFKTVLETKPQKKDRRMNRHIHFFESYDELIICPYLGCGGDYLSDRWMWRDKKPPKPGEIYNQCCHDDIADRPEDYTEPCAE